MVREELFGRLRPGGLHNAELLRISERMTKAVTMVVKVERLLIGTAILGALAFVLSTGHNYVSPSLFTQLQCWYNPILIKSSGGFRVDAPLEVLQTNEIHQPGIQVKRSTGRVAICLVGGARAFELTGKTLTKYLLNAYNDTDIFLHAPLDEDAHKFTLLKGASNLAVVRIFKPKHLVESDLAREVLTASNSPNGIQGLLQYFNLVEGCLDMVTKYESTHNIKYDWLIRTRVDGYWNGPPPPLTAFNSSAYHIPMGSHYGGLNDRFGMGTLNTSRAALARLSLIPLLHARGKRHLNSETAFKAQLEESGVPYTFLQLPFCIISRRRYSWPFLHNWAVPVASISTKGALSGAKCRPCTPIASGSEAQDLVSKLDKRWGWPGQPDGVELCDARGDWEPNWEKTLATVAGPASQVLQESQRVLRRSLADCVHDIREFQKQWELWDAPAAKTICLHGKLRKKVATR